MPYAFTSDVPATNEFYADVRAKLSHERPDGLIAHIVHTRPEGGLRYTDVWETKEHWDRFDQERVRPVLVEVAAAHGIPLDRSGVVFDEIDVIDVWV